MSKAAESGAAVAATRQMREDIAPAWPEALEAAGQRMVAGSSGILKELRQAALEALRKTGRPQAGSEDFTFVRLNEVLGFLGAVPEHAADGKSTRTFHVPKPATMPTFRSRSLPSVIRAPNSRQPSAVVILPALATTIMRLPRIWFRSIAFWMPAGLSDWAPLCVDGHRIPRSSSSLRTSVARSVVQL